MAHADAESLVRERLHMSLGFPAFGHPLYPAGDPRAAALLESLALPSAYADLARQVERLAGERPNIDFGLAALSAVHRLPSHARWRSSPSDVAWAGSPMRWSRPGQGR